MQVHLKHIPSYLEGAVSEPESPMISATLTFPYKRFEKPNGLITFLSFLLV